VKLRVGGFIPDAAPVTKATPAKSVIDDIVLNSIEEQSIAEIESIHMRSA
jgi:hypothetical protein